MSWQQLRKGCTASFIVSVVFLLAGPARAQGEASTLYQAKCAVCHGDDGKGDTAIGKKIGVRDFASPEVQKETDQQLIDITTNGKNKMPGYGKILKESQIKDLVAYVRDLAKKK
jgi:mono/diheme cytochrome c family protein